MLVGGYIYSVNELWNKHRFNAIDCITALQHGLRMRFAIGRMGFFTDYLAGKCPQRSTNNAAFTQQNSNYFAIGCIGSESKRCSDKKRLRP
jgi:hypothetical protein